MGTRKLYHLIQPILKLRAIKIGRDKLFDWMREFDLLIKPRRRYTQTTQSNHWLRKHPNLVKGIFVTEPEQVWVSDITYLKTDEGNMYLSMVTDAYSRRIMGYNIADNMEAVTVLNALKMAISQRMYTKQLIHHSDRGVQYCSSDYVSLATCHGIRMSMTENGDPYENALAERMNRTIKEEFGMDRQLPSRLHALNLVKEAITLYNYKRPHLALKMKTPDTVHKEKSRQLEATGTIL